LHQMLATDPLDCFVLFSSASAVLSSPLVSGYAAANAFLDSLAHYRAAAGQPALSINWGLWAGAGMGEQAVTDGHAPPSAHGVMSLKPNEALAALGMVLGTSSAQVGVFPVDWPTWRERYPAFTGLPLFSEILLGESEQKGGEVTLSPEELLALDPGRREQEVRRRLLAHAGAVLRLDPASINPHEPLTRLGIDSLMAVELKNRIDRELGPRLDVVHYLDGSGIERLTELLIETLSDAEIADANALLERLPELSDSEVDALLTRMQATNAVT
jgi:acyl carrier protein